MSSRVGIIVPTLGTRPEFLKQCLESIRNAGSAHICVVAPKDSNLRNFVDSGQVDQVVVDPGHGLSHAINKGFESLPGDIHYINWLGDDDLLAPDSISDVARILDAEPRTVLVYGSCNYLDDDRGLIWVNKSGQWASKILHFGPDLIPQPGALFRRSAFEKVGRLSENLDLAFDFDLILKLKRIGELRFINKTLSSFRWHSKSLTVDQRIKSVEEASAVRISHLPRILKQFSFIWEYPLKKTTLIAGRRVSERARRIRK